MGEEFGCNGYNKIVVIFFFCYSFGEFFDLQLQLQFIEIGVSLGYFWEGGKGMNFYFDYWYSFLKICYGVGGGSFDCFFDYEVFLGLCIGFDWSFQCFESEVGFFQFFNQEIEWIVLENEFIVIQLVVL